MTDRRYSHPLQSFGDGRLRNGRTKLDEADKAAIRGHFAAGSSAITIGRLWGISRSRVYQVLRAALDPEPSHD